MQLNPRPSGNLSTVVPTGRGDKLPYGAGLRVSSLPPCWNSVKAGPNRINAIETGIATIVNDPADPKKAILIPLAPTTEETGLLRVKATDFNEGFFTIIDLEIKES